MKVLTELFLSIFYSWIFYIISFKMRNVITWHWFIKNLVGTWRRNDVDATSWRRIDVCTTSCACWVFWPPLDPQYSKPCPPLQYPKPSYAYANYIHVHLKVIFWTRNFLWDIRSLGWTSTLRRRGWLLFNLRPRESSYVY